MSPKQARRAEILQHKIEQLELYHNTRCPSRKLRLVQRMIEVFTLRLEKLTCL